MDNLALADFLDRIASACSTYAARLRADGDGGTEVGTVPPHSPLEPHFGVRLGLRERHVMDYFAGQPRGYSALASEVAQGIGGYDQANIYFPLRTLTGKQLLEEVQGARPQRWRATEKLWRAYGVDEASDE